MQLPVSDYEFIDSETRQRGFIAQDVQAAIPLMVGYAEYEKVFDPNEEIPESDLNSPILFSDELVDRDGVTKRVLSFGQMTIRPMRLIPYLVQSVQELSAQNDALEGRIKVLEAKLP